MHAGRFAGAIVIGVLILSIPSVVQPLSASTGKDTIPIERAILAYGGAAIPIGSFAATSDEHGSFALPGIAFGAQFIAPITRQWNITGGIAFSFHQYDELGKQEVLHDSLPKYTVHADGYSLVMLLTGMECEILITSGFRLSGRAQAGILIGKHPEIREDNITPSGSGRRTIGSALATSPAFDVNCGIKTENGWWFGVTLAFSSPSYTLSVYEAHGTTPTAYQTKRVKSTIATIQLLLGYTIEI